MSALTNLSINKIGDSAGETSLLSFWFLDSLWPFSLVAFFLLICKSLSPQDTLSDLLGPKASLIFACFFKFFISFRDSRTVPISSLREP